MNDLIKHIQALNAKSSAWVAEDPKNRFASMLVEDAQHWLEYGITTVAEFEHYMLVIDVYETHRSVYGFKPSWSVINGLSDEQLRSELTVLDNQAKQEREREESDERQHTAAVERAMSPAPFWSLGDVFACMA